MVTWYWMRLFSISRRLRLDDGLQEVVNTGYLVLDEIVQHL
jgi:hypothetical protein